MKKLYCIAPFPEDATSYYRSMAVFVLEGLAGLYQTKLQEKCIETYTVFNNGNNR